MQYVVTCTNALKTRGTHTHTHTHTHKHTPLQCRKTKEAKKEKEGKENKNIQVFNHFKTKQNQTIKILII